MVPLASQRFVAVVRTDVSEERIASIIGVEIISEMLVTASVVLSSLISFALIMEAMRFSETSVLTGATRRHISEDGILQGHLRLF
jgi:hypothetical protein